MMKTLCGLAAVALLLAILLLGGEVLGQDSPLSPIPPPSRPQLTPTPVTEADMDRMAACWYLCKVTEGYTDGEPLVACYKECMATPITPTPTATPAPPESYTYAGAWWRSPQIACELWQTEGGYVLLCP